MSFIINFLSIYLLFSCAVPAKYIGDETELRSLCKKGQITRIHAIQGNRHRSPLENKTVSCISGIVTAVSGQGFYLQDTVIDDDENTSEAIFVVYDNSSIIKKGDRLFIEQARVREHNPSINQSNSLTVTQLVDVKLKLINSGNPLPEPIVIGVNGRQIPNQVIENDIIGYVGRDFGLFDPAEDGMDFFESLEGMYVEVRDGLAVSSTNRYREVTIVADGGNHADLLSDYGTLVIREHDFNPERILLDDSFIQIPNITIGTHFTGPIRGVISYDFMNYRLLPTEKLSYEISDAYMNPQLSTVEEDAFSIVSYNVKNLGGNDDAERFNTLAEHIVIGLNSPDILVLQEVLDDDGDTDSQIVSAEKTIWKIQSAIESINGPDYEFININPERNADGGIKGGNGRIVILYRTDKGLQFNCLKDAGPRTEVEIIKGKGSFYLSHNPGKIWPNNSAFRNSRKPLIAQFEYNGNPLFLIAVHFSSKGEDGALYGEIQPPPEPSKDRRVAQAKAVNGFMKRLLNEDNNAQIVVLGDINDFYWTETALILASDKLINTAYSIPERNRYSYIYEGNGQLMDQIFLSKSLYEKMISFQVLHINTNQIELEAFSDHDPVIVFLNFE